MKISSFHKHKSFHKQISFSHSTMDVVVSVCVCVGGGGGVGGREAHGPPICDIESLSE